MPKKRYQKAGRRPTKTQSIITPRNIGIAALGVVLVVAIIVVIITTQNKSAATPGAAAGGPTPALVGTKKYASAPPMLIDKTKQYTATVTMAKGGQFVIQLYADKAPLTVNSFVFLARNEYFNGITFHRVLQGFMAQGGDPTGTGSGGPGYEFAYEDSGYTFDKAGVVAMANTGPRTPTNGSQFFITFGPQPSLNGGYTIFGQVTSGMDVVNAIKLRDPDGKPAPTFTGDVIQTVTITEK
jgi:peptidylprolyl isomerase